jgi:2'-5' RNA ligase
LRGISSRGRFTLPENLHITLIFIGERNAAQAESIKTAMNIVVYAPFELEIDRLGCFKRSGGDIWWAGIRENKTLNELYKSLTSELQKHRIVFDYKEFNPHITLGREVSTKSQPRQIESFTEKVTKIELMKSERIAGKLTYTPIHEVLL